MKIIEISGRNREPQVKKTYEGCRGIIVRDGKVLLSYYKKKDQYLIPGGGIETGESLAECCAREIEEECGIVVKPTDHYLTLEEYYHAFFFKSHYFICEYVGEGERRLTRSEIENGLEPRWVELEEAFRIFGNYESYKDTDEILYGAYNREYIALVEYKGEPKE